MKTAGGFLVWILFAFNQCHSQDYLIKRNGDSLKVKIVEVNLTEVKYKEYKNLMGITYGIYKTEVFRIRYENGRVESFSDEGLIVNELTAEEKCNCGRSDAANYHGLKGAAFACGVYCGPGAMLGTALIKHTPRMGARTIRRSENQNLFADPIYMKCYNKKAKRDLLNVELQGFVFSIVVPVAIVYLLLR